MKGLALGILAFAAVLGPGAALRAQPAEPKSIQPGYWEYKTKLIGLTVDTKRKCVTPADVDEFLSGPCNRHYTCVYPTREVADGRANFDGYWQDKKGRRAKVRASGTYQAKSFVLDARGTSTQGLPLAATLEARWIAPSCPAGAD